MKARKTIVNFILIFAITLIVSAGVTFIWSLSFHPTTKVNWETSFQLAIILSIIITILDAKNQKLKKE